MTESPPTIQKRVRHRAKKKATTANTPTPAQSITELPHIDVGATTTPRQTLPTNANILGSFPYAFLPRRQYQAVDLSSVNVSILSPQQVIDLLSDADPDVSLAWWNFLLLTVGHWEVDARSPNDQEDPAAKNALNEIISVCNGQWGGFQNILYQWVMSVLLEGACSGETIPTEDLKDVHDIVPVTPWTIYFQRDANQDLMVYQWQPMLANGQVNLTTPAPTVASLAGTASSAAGFRMMNTTTFGYVPFMPMVDDPYGRMPFASIFQVIVFDNQLLQDLRRWAHVNAWGRIDVSIVQEMIQKLMPAAVQADKREIITFVNNYIADVAKSYNNIGPDDTFIHLDNVKMSNVDASGKTMQIDALIKVVERKKFRALRMLPILMGSNEGTTETHGTVQWDIMSRGIEGIQTTVSTLANRLLTVALRLRGFTAHAELVFESVRASDRMADATSEAIEIKNWAAKRDEGWITQDEASIALTGSPAVAEAPNPDNYVALNQIVPGDPPAVLPPPPTPPKQDNTSDDNNEDENTDDTTTKATLTPRERELIALAMRGMLHKSISAIATRAKKLPSTARVALQTDLAVKVAAHLRGITIGEQTIKNIVETHTSRFLARSKRFDPDLADGVGAIIDLRDGGITPLTAGQRAAIKANIARMLSDDISDSDEDFTDEIAAARQDAYTLGGQEGADVVGLVGTFILTNAVILAQMVIDARSHVQSIQSTTRDQLATAALVALEDGSDSATLLDVLNARLDTMAASRSDGIGMYEVASAFWDGTRDVWGKNGVPSKSWGTNGDPDPHAGNGPTPCIDNEDAGVIPMNETFPSGDSEPPAHLLCECFIEPSGDVSDAAQTDPWLGD